RIVPRRLAVAGAFVQVRAAPGTQALACLRTQRFHRQGEDELFVHQLAEVERLVLVVRGRQIVFGDFALLAAGRPGDLRHVTQLEGAVDRNLERLQAAAAFELQPRLYASGDAIGVAIL